MLFYYSFKRNCPCYSIIRLKVTVVIILSFVWKWLLLLFYYSFNSDCRCYSIIRLKVTVVVILIRHFSSQKVLNSESEKRNEHGTFVENTHLKITRFQNYKDWYLIHSRSDKAFKHTIVIFACRSHLKLCSNSLKKVGLLNSFEEFIN